VSVRPVTLEDIVGRDRYEQMRDERRRRIIALKKLRRVEVGDKVSFVFENTETVLFQIQEMLRAESITDLDGIRAEIDTYNGLLPGPGELAATMLIELQDPKTVREELPRWFGIDECVRLEIGDRSVPAVFEGGRSREDKVSAVQYVRFPVGADGAKRLEELPVRLVVDHAHYRAAAELGPDARAELAKDLAP
jgi:hypothetical protein